MHGCVQLIRAVFVSPPHSSFPSSGFLFGALLLALGCCPAFDANAAIIGTNVPANPLTAERIATLPPGQQAAWREYLERSQRQMQADRAAVEAELRQAGLRDPMSPPEGRGVQSVPLSKPAAWYGQPEARRITDIIVSFQTPAGGWSKNLDMSKRPRAPGECASE